MIQNNAELDIQFGYEPGQISPEYKSFIFSLLRLSEDETISVNALLDLFCQLQFEQFGKSEVSSNATFVAEIYYATQVALEQHSNATTLLTSSETAGLVDKWVLPGNGRDQLSSRTFNKLHHNIGELSPEGESRINAALLNKIPVTTLQTARGLTDNEIARVTKTLSVLARSSEREAFEGAPLFPNPSEFSNRWVTEGQKVGQLPEEIFSPLRSLFLPDYSADSYQQISAKKIAETPVSQLLDVGLSDEQVQAIKQTLEYILHENLTVVVNDEYLPMADATLLKNVRIYAGEKPGQLKPKIFALLSRCGFAQTEHTGNYKYPQVWYIDAASLAENSEIRLIATIRRCKSEIALQEGRPLKKVPSGLRSADMTVIKDCLVYWETERSDSQS